MSSIYTISAIVALLLMNLSSLITAGAVLPTSARLIARGEAPSMGQHNGSTWTNVVDFTGPFTPGGVEENGQTTNITAYLLEHNPNYFNEAWELGYSSTTFMDSDFDKPYANATTSLQERDTPYWTQSFCGKIYGIATCDAARAGLRWYLPRSGQAGIGPKSCSRIYCSTTDWTTFTVCNNNPYGKALDWMDIRTRVTLTAWSCWIGNLYQTAYCGGQTFYDDGTNVIIGEAKKGC